MRQSIVKAKLAKNEPVLVTTLHLTDPSLYELVGLMGFDGIWMDLEHHAYSVETADCLMRASRAGRTDIVARPAKGEFMRMGRLLEAGASGILYPRCSGAQEATAVVRWAKFHPQGERGFDGGNGDMPYCTMDMKEYVRLANEETFVAVQIEDPRALQEAEAMAAVDGVDVLFLGPGDFSILSGVPGDFNHPKVQAAVDSVAQAAKNTGRAWGMPAFSLDHARQLVDLGGRFIAHGADIIMVKRALEAIQKDFGPLGFRFDSQLG